MIMITGVWDGFDAGDHPFFSFCIHDQKFGVWSGRASKNKFVSTTSLERKMSVSSNAFLLHFLDKKSCLVNSSHLLLRHLALNELRKLSPNFRLDD